MNEMKRNKRIFTQNERQRCIFIEINMLDISLSHKRILIAPRLRVISVFWTLLRISSKNIDISSTVPLFKTLLGM